MHDKRTDIQGLRAWAVISVVVFHFFPSLLPYGYLGVDVFFVLSGFLITLVLEGRPTNILTYYNFYFKRLRRIMPLALLIVLLGVITIACLQEDYEFANGIKSALYSLFFIKNLQPQSTVEEDYFQALENANDFFTHFWSLCVEIQFYLIAPFLLHFFKPKTENAISSFSYFTVIANASFCYSQLRNPQEAFDSTLARLWQFLAGAVAFHSDLIFMGRKQVPESEKLIPDNGEVIDQTSRKRALMIPAAFALTATALVAYYGDGEAVLRCCTTFVITLALAFRSKSVFLCHSSLQLIGDISYSLYLIHWPIVCVLDIVDFETWQMKLCAMFAALALSIICHYGYEQKYLTLPIKPTLALVFGLYATTLLVIWASNEMHLKAVEKDSTLTLTGSNRELTQEEIIKLNAKMARENDLRYKDCTLRDGKNPIGFCDLTNGNGSLHFMIMGNSYSANLGGLIQEHFRPHYGQLQTRAIAQCEPLVSTPTDPYCRNATAAHEKFDADIASVRPDVLFLVARYINPNQPIERPIENDTQFNLMEKRLKFFEEHVQKKIFILEPFPKAARPGDLEKLMKRKGLPMMPYMPEGIDKDAKPMKERVKKLAEKCSKCVIFTIEVPFLNKDGNFTVLSPQKLWYFDGPRHLNILGRQLVEPVFERMSENFDRLLDSKYPENSFE
ncbi:hypothetical protein PMAYCL1PPCAC_03622 [Pristionchus mayeri]|uniref:Acyltransferase n=1 Tax=Pristionchus mayeri TaxID=1317129 RepID=A0AAN4Z2L9_9BILA|nr:hypothetical protein PMAYCL1PPCAC_03622 [Pristionchus mayeri]